MMAQTLLAITGQVKCQGYGVANVVVTNGFDCVLTDASGKYTIPYHRDARLYMSLLLQAICLNGTVAFLYSISAL